jgi:hypothetical protein
MRLGFLAPITPYLIEFGGEPSAGVKLLGATDPALYLFRGQGLQPHFITTPAMER